MQKKKTLTEKEKAAYLITTRRAGLSTLRKYGKAHFAAIGRKGAEARWGKKK